MRLIAAHFGLIKTSCRAASRIEAVAKPTSSDLAS